MVAVPRSNLAADNRCGFDRKNRLFRHGAKSCAARSAQEIPLDRFQERRRQAWWCTSAFTYHIGIDRCYLAITLGGYGCSSSATRRNGGRCCRPATQSFRTLVPRDHVTGPRLPIPHQIFDKARFDQHDDCALVENRHQSAKRGRRSARFERKEKAGEDLRGVSWSIPEPGG
jgi:hypothetical protein